MVHVGPSSGSLIYECSNTKDLAPQSLDTGGNSARVVVVAERKLPVEFLAQSDDFRR